MQAGRPNPGLFSACALYLPISAWCYSAAAQDGMLGAFELVVSLVLGAAGMAAVILVLVLAQRFGYPDATEPGEAVVEAPAVAGDPAV